MDNQSRIAKGIKVVLLAIYGILTIMTCAGVWNFNPEGFIKWCALALGLCNAGVIVYLAKTIKTGE